MEEELTEMPGKRSLKAVCGKYGHPDDAEICVDEVFMQDGKLYAKFFGGDGEFTSQLYPIGKKTFGRKGGFAKIIFGENCLTVNGITCKKL